MAEVPRAELITRRPDGQAAVRPSRPGRTRAPIRALVAVGAVSMLICVALIAAFFAGRPARGPSTAAIRAIAITRSQAASASLQVALTRLARLDRACRKFTCHIAIDAQTSRDYAAFAAAITAIPMPAGRASNAAGQLEEAAAQTALAGDALAAATTAIQLKNLSTMSPTMADVIQVQQDSAYLRYVLAGQ